MVILGIDPGYAILGFGVVEYKSNHFQPLNFGAITTKAGQPLPLRLEQLYDGVANLLERYRPDAMSIEELFFQNNQKTAIAVAQARGVVLLCARKHGVQIAEYTPLQVKQSVVGYGRAEKAQVMEMTRMILNLKERPRPDDAADALALAICHGHSAGSLLKKIGETI